MAKEFFNANITVVLKLVSLRDPIQRDLILRQQL